MVDNKPVILIVDDHIQTAVSLSYELDNKGFKTYQAYNADKAIETSRAKSIDLILMEINFGNGTMNGYQIAELLSKQKMILMSGSKMDPKKISKLKNVVGTIKKPVIIDDLLKMLRKYFKMPEPEEF